MSKKSLIIKVFGKVQGVGFRHYTMKKAHELKLTGFVQNKADGSVYIEAEGDKNKIDEFADWVKEGPTWARVDDVSIQETGDLGYNEFRVR